MSDSEVVVVFLVMAAGVMSIALVLFAGVRTRRLRVLEHLLQRPDLDEVTRRALVDELRRPRLRSSGEGAGSRLSWLFGIAWVGLFLGIGCGVSGDRDAEAFGAVLALVSFGLVSLPMALRELERRRA